MMMCSILILPAVFNADFGFRRIPIVDFKRPYTIANTTFGAAVTAQRRTWPEGAACPALCLLHLFQHQLYGQLH